MMISLQEKKCHNINLVSPTHFVPQILDALCMAADMGLNLPIVYNTGTYDSLETLKLLDGIIDIYMPDAKYGSSLKALKYSGVRNYTETMEAALMEMHRQTGDLVVDKNGIAVKGMLIRHLVLPSDAAASEVVLKFIASRISEDSHVNVMRQYKPCWNAKNYPEINHSLSENEYQKVLHIASGVGLSRGF
jgi:putative pyruvate formate lyase activating enzyme